MKKNKIRIAIIDDGINPKLLPPDVYIKHYVAHKHFIIKQCKHNYNKTKSHGTMCAGIICKYSKQIKLYSIKVKDSKKKGNIGNLVSALKLCSKRRFDVINLSIGSCCNLDKDILFNVISKISQKGSIIVAAHSNDGQLTYPASFENVLGVRSQISRYDYQICNEIVAPGRHIIRLRDELHITDNSNSYATAFVTSQVAELMLKHQRKDISFINTQIQSLLGKEVRP